MAKYARVEITFILLLGTATTVVSAFMLGWWALLLGGLTLALLSFYRDPPRSIPAGDSLLLAPADGRITRVERGYHAEGSDIGEIRIVIFLSVFNVHINRTPCAGTVTGIEYSPGEFLNALRSEATDRNESNLVAIQPRAPLPGPVHVRQIAGVLARRVVCKLKRGDDVEAGQRFGMIKFGSQTEVRVPDGPHWMVCVHPGDHVKAGRSVLARLDASSDNPGTTSG